MKNIRNLFFIGLILIISSQKLTGQATYGSIKLTANYDQLKFEVPGENRYWLMSKTIGSNNKAYGFYSPDEGGWFTYWKQGSGDMILSKGKIGLGTTSPDQMLSIYNPNKFNVNMEGQNQDHISLQSQVHGVNSYFGGITWKSGGRRRASISAVQEHTDADHIGLAFFTKGTDGPGPIGESMRITRDGNVGVGTTQPRTKFHVFGPSESHSAKVTSFGNLSSDILLTNNTYRSFEGSTYTDGSGGSLNRYFHYRSIHGGYLNYDGRGYGFYSQGFYPRMFMEVISGNGGNIKYLKSDSPIKDGFIYQQIKGPSGGPVSEPIRATDDNSTWLWGIKSDGQMVVANSLKTKEVIVTTDDFPDYVFEEEYPLLSLDELQHFIITHHHLPEIPSASEVKENGIELGNMNKLLLQKIEELTLYTIEQEEKINSLENKNKQMIENHEKEISFIKDELLEIKNLLKEN